MNTRDNFSNCVAASIAAMLFSFSIGAMAQKVPNNPGLSTAPSALSEGQREVFAVVSTYEKALNAQDTDAIVALFAENSVAEWNDKPTFATREQKIAGYNALFRNVKFKTVFEYDAIEVFNDTAIVRTHHRPGAFYVEDGKKMLDFNREVYVLRKMNGVWKIVLYTFNRDAVQGQG